MGSRAASDLRYSLANLQPSSLLSSPPMIKLDASTLTVLSSSVGFLSSSLRSSPAALGRASYAVDSNAIARIYGLECTVGLV